MSVCLDIGDCRDTFSLFPLFLNLVCYPVITWRIPFEVRGSSKRVSAGCGRRPLHVPVIVCNWCCLLLSASRRNTTFISTIAGRFGLPAVISCRHTHICGYAHTDGASNRRCQITNGWVFGSGMQLPWYGESCIHREHIGCNKVS